MTAPYLEYHGILALELVLTWASFSPIFPLLTAPRRDPFEEPPSSVPRLACAVAATVAVAAAAASARRMRIRIPMSEQHGRRRGGDGFVRAISRGAVGLVAGALVFHAVAVVLGAPVLRRASETLTFSLLMSSLTSLPVSMSSEKPLEDCVEFLRGSSSPTAAHERGTMVPAAGCALGAWLGAIPLCLDWEQPWQAWPLPMCAGGLLGFSLGCLLLLGVGFAENVRRSFSFWRAEKRA
ncbi:unnamed protein product [Pylaiella littoralis]